LSLLVFHLFLNLQCYDRKYTLYSYPVEHRHNSLYIQDEVPSFDLLHQNYGENYGKLHTEQCYHVVNQNHLQCLCRQGESLIKSKNSMISLFGKKKRNSQAYGFQ